MSDTKSCSASVAATPASPVAAAVPGSVAAFAAPAGSTAFAAPAGTPRCLVCAPDLAYLRSHSDTLVHSEHCLHYCNTAMTCFECKKTKSLLRRLSHEIHDPIYGPAAFIKIGKVARDHDDMVQTHAHTPYPVNPSVVKVLSF